MKSYLRYEPSIKAGVIASPSCNVVFDRNGSHVLTGAHESVNLYHLRHAKHAATLSAQHDNYPYNLVGDVQVLRHTDSKASIIAAGYSTGDVRIFDYESKALITTLRGHRSAVTSLTFGDDGKTLASGSADCDIIIWDMVAHVGVCRLRGHKDAVTGLGFIYRGTQQLIVSTSKDTLLKVWDVTTQYCIQTIVGHRCEIWSLAVVAESILNTDESDASSSSSRSPVRIWTGSSDEWIRGYRVVSSSDDSTGNDVMLSDNENVLEYYGCVKRSDRDRCSGLHVDGSGCLLAVQSTSKNIEIFKIRSLDEVKKKFKRRLKRQREKSSKMAENPVTVDGVVSFSAWDESTSYAKPGEELTGSHIGVDTERVILVDEIELSTTIRCSSKVRGFSFSPRGLESSKSSGTTRYVVKSIISLLDNSLDYYEIPIRGTTEESSQAFKISSIELLGHRADVRGVSVSEDGLLVATCSSDGVKIWNSNTLNCTRTCSDAGQGMCLSFTPGARYVVIGTKDGHVQIADTTSGALVMDESAHEGTIWSLSSRPDGKGFATGGADKIVRFWDFTLAEGGSALSAVATRELQMTHDVLCVAFSRTTKAEKLMVAIGILDNTVKVFYDDSLKFFLSLYGHRLPVMALDFSSDGVLLATGSADKTVKIWGMDFGDCHRSIIAHGDSITSIRFQPDTHYFFSSGKDGLVKYWDADRFEQILMFPGHVGAVWSCDVSYDGSMCVSVGQDRSIRIWERSDDMVFIEEERDREFEAQVEKTVILNTKQDNENAVGTKSSESVKGGEAIMEALDLVEEEIAEIIEWCTVQSQSIDPKKAIKMKERRPNIRLLGLNPYQYFIRVLKQIKAPDMEQALLVLPFHYVSRLISLLLKIARQGLEVELCARCCILLLRSHQQQIITTRSLLTEISGLQDLLLSSVAAYRLLIGTNLAASKAATQAINDNMQRGFGPASEAPILTKLSHKRKQQRNTRDRKNESKKAKI